MKTSIITSILAAFLSVMSLSAGNPAKVYENVETTNDGIKKEYITYNENISRAESKVVYVYDNKGYLNSKAFYKWNNEKGWLMSQEYNYSYNVDGKVAYLTFTKWDNNKARMEQLVHLYDNDGNFLTVESVNLNGEEVAYVK